MKKNIFSSGSVILSVVIFISSTLSSAFAIPAYAEAVPGLTLAENVTWATSSEPYIIQGEVTVPVGITLTVDSSARLIFDGGILNIQGALNIENTSLDLASSAYPVLKIRGGTVTAANIEVSGGGYLAEVSSGGSLNVSSSTFKDSYGSGDYIQAYGGSGINLSGVEAGNINSTHFIEAYNDPKIQIENSNFSFNTSAAGLSIYSGTPDRSFFNIASSSFSNQKGQSIDSYGGVPVHISSSAFMHGKGTAISLYTGGEAVIEKSNFSDNDIAFEAYNASTTIRESNIENNRVAGVIAYGGTFVGKNVWWGDASGPVNENNRSGKGNSVTATVDAVPWLTERWRNMPVVSCCSSILFIPGLEGSRLYKKGALLENQLWEPNRNGDVQKLFLDESGKSIDPSIYTRDVIDKTNITGGSFLDTSVYDDLIKKLNGMKDSGKISAWRSLPYDWRFGPETIVKEGIKTATGTIDVINVIEQMASSSKSGKVAIVTHSNGGLVAKVLISELQKRGREKLVDQLIMVAAPEFGTPSAISALLHGDGQDFAKGFVLRKGVARELGINMATGYNLLPSEKYFSSGFSSVPPVVFTKEGSLTGLYGAKLTDRKSLESFLLADKDDRKNKALSKMSTDQIAVLNKDLINASDKYHDVFDSWIPPADIKVTSIIGTGVSTVAGISYEDNGELLHPERSASLSEAGDGIVLAGEPHLRTGTVYRLDLKELNGNEKKNYRHVDVMNADPIRSMISMLIENSTTLSTSSLPQYIFGDTKKTPSRAPYVFSVYSPVSIEALDSAGRRTGISSSTVSDDYDILQQDIPNSSYISVGESKQIVLQDIPAAIKLNGTDVGTFTFTIESPQSSGSSTLESFVDIPVTPLEKIELSGLSSGSALSLSIDRDGDGHVDKVIRSASSTDIRPSVSKKDILSFINIFESDIKTQIQSKERRKRYADRLSDIEKLWKSEEVKKASNMVNSSITRIGSRIKQSVGKVTKDKNKDMINRSDRAFLYERFTDLKTMIDLYRKTNQK